MRGSDLPARQNLELVSLLTTIRPLMAHSMRTIMSEGRLVTPEPEPALRIRTTVTQHAWRRPRKKYKHKLQCPDDGMASRAGGSVTPSLQPPGLPAEE